MLAKRTDTGRYDRALLRRVQKDVSGDFRRTVEPVRVIKCAAIDAVYCRKSFQVEVKLRTASCTEIDCDPLWLPSEACVKVAGLPEIISNDVFSKIGSTM